VIDPSILKTEPPPRHRSRLSRLPSSILARPPHAADSRASGFVVCRACSAARRCKSSTQPDGGEGLAMRKGYRREAMSEGSAEQTCELMDKNRIQGASVGRAGNVLRSPYPSRTRGVDPATVHGRRLNLPREICSVSLRRLGPPRDGLTAGQKSAEGVLGHVVGKVSEALRDRKVEQTDRPSRKRGLKARTREVASRT
jgi:hypothetical protein